MGSRSLAFPIEFVDRVVWPLREAARTIRYHPNHSAAFTW